MLRVHVPGVLDIVLGMEPWIKTKTDPKISGIARNFILGVFFTIRQDSLLVCDMEQNKKWY